MNDLLRNWIPLVNSLLSRLSIHPNEHDECRQAALLRLWKSIEEGKVMTVTFARIRAKGATALIKVGTPAESSVPPRMMSYYQERLLAIIEQADYRPLTKKAYRSDVRHLCRHVERIDVPSLQRYGKFLRDTYAPATAARRLHALSILFDHLVAERSLQTNPLIRVKKPVPAPHRRLAFTYDDVHRVLETMNDETVYAFSFLLLHTGLRFSEARDLQLADIDFMRDQVLVRSGKGDQSRQVPLHHALRDVLARYIETIRPDALPLFCEDSGRPVNPAKFRRVLREASNRCLGRILRPHDIRVTFATTLYHVHQTDILTIMRLLGHSDGRTTQHYVLPSHDIAHSSVNRLKRTDD